MVRTSPMRIVSAPVRIMVMVVVQPRVIIMMPIAVPTEIIGREQAVAPRPGGIIPRRVCGIKIPVNAIVIYYPVASTANIHHVPVERTAEHHAAGTVETHNARRICIVGIIGVVAVLCLVSRILIFAVAVTAVVGVNIHRLAAHVETLLLRGSRPVCLNRNLSLFLGDKIHIIYLSKYPYRNKHQK